MVRTMHHTLPGKLLHHSSIHPRIHTIRIHLQPLPHNRRTRHNQSIPRKTMETPCSDNIPQLPHGQLHPPRRLAQLAKPRKRTHSPLQRTRHNRMRYKTTRQMGKKTHTRRSRQHNHTKSILNTYKLEPRITADTKKSGSIKPTPPDTIQSR